MQEYVHKIRQDAPRGLTLGATGDSSMIEATVTDSPTAFGYIGGSVLGGAAVGAGIGYVANGRSYGAITGAAAGAGVSALVNGIGEVRYGRKVFGAALSIAAVGMLVAAWMRKP